VQDLNGGGEGGGGVEDGTHGSVVGDTAGVDEGDGDTGGGVGAAIDTDNWSVLGLERLIGASCVLSSAVTDGGGGGGGGGGRWCERGEGATMGIAEGGSLADEGRTMG